MPLLVEEVVQLAQALLVGVVEQPVVVVEALWVLVQALLAEEVVQPVVALSQVEVVEVVEVEEEMGPLEEAEVESSQVGVERPVTELLLAALLTEEVEQHDVRMLEL